MVLPVIKSLEEINELGLWQAVLAVWIRKVLFVSNLFQNSLVLRACCGILDINFSKTTRGDH
jgi:hypothetical protein